MRPQSFCRLHLWAASCLFVRVGSIESDTRDVELTVEELDKAQRKLAASWEDNKYCNIQQEDGIVDLPGFCMAEPAGTFVARSNRKQVLVEEVVATSLGDFQQHALSTNEPQPAAYAFTMTQRYLNGSLLQHGSFSDEVDGLANDCAGLRDLRLHEVDWRSHRDSRVDDENAAFARQSLVNDGAVLIRGLLSNETLLDEARRYLLQQALRGDANSTEYVHGAKHRHHVRLRPDSDPIADRLFRLLVHGAASILLPLVSTMGAVVEFASFLTNPGATGQGFHSDVGMAFDESQAPHYSLFLFLADLDDEAYGPLQVAPRTHALSEVRETARYAVRDVVRGGDAELERRCLNDWKLAPVQAGDAALYDGTGLHRGTANNSSRTRIVVYLSVLGVGSLAFGPTYAIDESLLDPPTRIGEVLAGEPLLSAYLVNPHRRRSSSSDSARSEL